MYIVICFVHGYLSVVIKVLDLLNKALNRTNAPFFIIPFCTSGATLGVSETSWKSNLIIKLVLPRYCK